MTEAQVTFIEDMGQLMSGWGIPRNTGRIYAFLLLQHDPASLDDIVVALGVAKSGASVAARQLAQFGLARAVGQSGTRRVLYEAFYSIESIIAARSGQLRDLQSRLRQGARAAPAGQGRQKLQMMADWSEAFADEMPLLARRLGRRLGK
jgi:DNA-binding transcriptional regulator GbsR (MarR family)